MLALERALDVAQQPGVRLCTVCGAAAELDAVLRGFDHDAVLRGFDHDADEG